MKNTSRLITLMTLVIAGLFLFGTAYAGNDGAPRTGYVDLNGDGINDNAKDDDGDGIPNCLDEDFVKSEDGTANKNGNTYTYNFQYKLQPKWQVQSKWVMFQQSKNKVSGETPEVPFGNAGIIGDGIHNPGMNVNAIKTGPVDAGHNGGTE